ncbi:hypothetical protein OAB57_03070 [Bacteriovoracaceae bacterium]|nr:hypothetical protein [Bacteriovoracaceae bacterium]
MEFVKVIRTYTLVYIILFNTILAYGSEERVFTKPSNLNTHEKLISVLTKYHLLPPGKSAEDQRKSSKRLNKYSRILTELIDRKLEHDKDNKFKESVSILHATIAPLTPDSNITDSMWNQAEDEQHSNLFLPEPKKLESRKSFYSKVFIKNTGLVIGLTLFSTTQLPSLLKDIQQDLTNNNSTNTDTESSSNGSSNLAYGLIGIYAILIALNLYSYAKNRQLLTSLRKYIPKEISPRNNHITNQKTKRSLNSQTIPRMNLALLWTKYERCRQDTLGFPRFLMKSNKQRIILCNVSCMKC